MTELKRPEIRWTTLIGHNHSDPVYEQNEMDSFLSQIAEKLKEAGGLREKGAYYKAYDRVDGERAIKNLKDADAIEEGIIKKLEGDEK